MYVVHHWNTLDARDHCTSSLEQVQLYMHQRGARGLWEAQGHACAGHLIRIRLLHNLLFVLVRFVTVDRSGVSWPDVICVHSAVGGL